MINKNDIVTLTIESITSEGSGIGRYEGMAIFVPMTAPQDIVQVRIVKVQKSYCYGIIDKLVTPSPSRISIDCEAFRRCGGCSLRHLDYQCELEQKEQWVTDAIRRLGELDIPVREIIPSPDVNCYRNKAQYPFGKDEQGKAFCGFYAQRSHSIIPAEQCRLQPELFSTICRAVCEYIDEQGGSIYDEAADSGLFRHLYIRHAKASGKVMVCLVINGDGIPSKHRLIDRLTSCSVDIASIQLNHNTRKTNVILGECNTLLWGSPAITDTLCGVEIDISPLSFYQVNRNGAEVLYQATAKLAELQDGQLLLDLYCGAGTIGLSMVRGKPSVGLVGVEIVGAAVENARHNAERAGIVNARFIEGDAGTAASVLVGEGLRPDVVVLDPPRKGCDTETLQAVVDMSPHRVVMVSCNAATMARDARWLANNGYQAIEVQPVDMFPRTAHVEAICLFISDNNTTCN